jgi:diguanylate cyclase (GGDEF)-like protein
MLVVTAVLLLLAAPAYSLLLLPPPASADANARPIATGFSQAAGSLAGGAAVIIIGLLGLLFIYRRRHYILYWAGGWACFALSMFAVGHAYERPQIAWLAYGGSQFLSICHALLFVVAAESYRLRTRVRRAHVVFLLPFGIWFLLAPVALGIRAVHIPGHLVTAALLLIAGGAHGMIFRETRLLGAGVVGVMLALTGLVNLWMLTEAAAPGASPTGTLLLQLALYLVTALGMQLMTFEDMTLELRRTNSRMENAQADLRQLVVTDALTGCRNRRFFDEIITHELSSHRRYGTPLSLLFVDVDHFKKINDTLGHAAGDRLLREVAAFLMRNTRDADYVFRWGGDEFLLLLSCREDEAMRRGHDLQADFTRATAESGLPDGVGLSYGCAEVSPNTQNVHDALRLADERMYANKRAMRVSESRAVQERTAS